MKKNADFYNLSQSLAGSLYQAAAAVQKQEGETTPTPPILMQLRGGYAESPAWFLVQALEFEPPSLTVDNLRVRDIYASEDLVAAILELMRSEGWLIAHHGAFILTAGGRELISSRLIDGTRRLGKVDLGDWAPNVGRLEYLLEKINDASLKCENPPGTWCLAHSRNRAVLSSGNSLARIRQFTSDWNAFRDDAHMAAFKSVEPRAFVWEAFTLLSRPEPRTAAEINQALFYRGYNAAAYENGLISLIKRGWVEKSGQTFIMTPLGQAILADVEDLTNKYFFGPWEILSKAETEELYILLGKLKEKLDILWRDQKN
jgi:hypothetical protein